MPRPAPRQGRWRTGALAVLIAVLVPLAAPASRADARGADAAVDTAAGLTVSGRGLGHGWGMSQYGAYGAAKRGLDWRDILTFYYPGTTIAQADVAHLRVWVSADTDGDLAVLPSAGLRVYNVGTSASFALPVGSTYTRWRMTRAAGAYRLQYRNPRGAWVTVDTPGVDPSRYWRFDNAANLLRVVLPDGTVRDYRGQAGLAVTPSGPRTVTRVALEDYVAGVVPAEMPTSWASDAVAAQAVAARSYALRTRAGYLRTDPTRLYDICDTTACQVYKGVAQTYPRGSRVVFEDARSRAAVQATRGRVLTYHGEVAFTQFASSNGGARARGDFPYLAAGPDPYDDVAAPQAWTRTFSRARLTAAFGGIGTVTRVQVLTRDGSGAWGGRVQTVRLTGTRGAKTVSGDAVRRALGLRSTLFAIRAG